MALNRMNNKTNLISLQFLRAIAASSVVYLHAIYSQSSDIFPAFGKFGVDIFFVLSGFVMALVIDRGQTARNFLISRVARVVPLYWLITLFLFLVVLVKPEYLITTTANISNFVLSLFFIPHFRDAGTMHPVLAVGWTLNYEMFFYLCIWSAIVLTRKFYLILTISILIILSIFGGLYSDHQVLNAFFGRSYLLEFILGLLAFQVYKRQLFNPVNNVCLIIMIASCYAFMAYVEVHKFSNIRVILYGLPATLLMLFMLSLEQSVLIKEGFISNVFTKIGDASYAIYLSHLYIIEGIRRVILKNTYAEHYYTHYGIALSVILALSFGYLVYIFLDKPMSKFVRTYLSSKFS